MDKFSQTVISNNRRKMIEHLPIAANEKNSFQATDVSGRADDGTSMIRKLLALSVVIAFAGAVLAYGSIGIGSDADQISAVEALERVEAGEVMLIDIRTSDEWRKTGVAALAKTNSMHQVGFFERIEQLTGGDKDKQIALICARGGRSSRMQSALRERGYSNVADVSEGMLGSSIGPGWLKRGFPLKTYEGS